MKTMTLLFALGFAAGCSSPTDEQNAAAPDTTDSTAPVATDAPAAPAAGDTATSATGVVEAVDPAAKTVTIAHGPVEVLQWPAMTMTFKAPNVDLATVEEGDQVSFEFTSAGMDGTITSIRRR